MCGDLDALAGAMNQGNHKALVVLRGKIRAARQRLDGNGAGNLRGWKHVVAIEQLLGFEIPIGGKNILQFQHGRSGDADHQLFVSDSFLEIGGHKILRAGIGDPAIEDRDLAMIAKVQPGRLPAEKTDRKHFLDGNPQGGQLGDQSGQSRARSHRVHQHPAGNPALDGPAQSGNDGGRRGIIRKYVKQQVNVVPGLIDVGHQAGDNPIIIHQDLGGVATKSRHLAQIFRQKSCAG